MKLLAGLLQKYFTVAISIDVLLNPKGIAVTEPLDQSTLAQLTAEIAAAYVGSNQVPLADMTNLIRSIADTLQRLGQPLVEETVSKTEPMVPIKRSIRPDHLVCLICGKHQTMLKRHLAQYHDVDPPAYRTMFGLSADYPMVAPDYAAKRSELAKSIGLGRKKEPEPKPKRANAAKEPVRRRKARAAA